MAEPPRGVRAGDFLLVVHNFEARGEDELTLRRGDKVEVLELDDGFGDGWYLGKNVADNRSGLFPGVYTTVPPRLNIRRPDPTPDSSVSEPASTQSNSDVATPALAEEKTPQPSPPAAGLVPDLGVLIPSKPVAAEQSVQHEPQRSGSSFSSMTAPRGVQRTISETMDNHGPDSPVINETLSVIDEHISNFSTPRHSYVGQDQRSQNDSGSEYSSHISHRMSYVPGTETDEEDDKGPSEAEVRAWDSKQTADHLRSLGVESKHCDIFENEEITGDVLLDMDQEFIYMKDFDFGVMGRRLKTWYKIKAFQEEIRGPASLRQSISPSGSSQHGRNHAFDDFDRSQSRAGTIPFLPRIPSVNESGPKNRSRSDTYNSTDGIPPRFAFNAPRPSADSIRQSNYNKRHSSIDTTVHSPQEPPKQAASAPRKPGRNKSSSFDRTWTMAAAADPPQSRPGTSQAIQTIPAPQIPDRGSSAVNLNANANGPSAPVTVDPTEIERGYFSGGELEARKPRNLLRKRANSGRSFSHSRQSSGVSRRHSRFGSTDSIGTGFPRKPGQPAQSPVVRQRSQKPGPLEMIDDESHSPSVTNLEDDAKFPSKTASTFIPFQSKQNGDSSAKSSPTSNLKGVSPKVHRAIGFRAISDAVTGRRSSPISAALSTSSAKDSPKSPTRTESSTPSGTSKSFEVDSTDGSMKAGDDALGLVNRSKASQGKGARSKKETSAYMRGLEKKTPQEQIVGCDYYGWMKKKSSNLITTWKPRLFVLRGRRLSYYYSEDDTEERGLIDISSHRVFRADQDTITSLHATLTGAKSSPIPAGQLGTPSPSSDSKSASGSTSRNSSTAADVPFIFKLVPPKAGSARAVQFTKPSVHYFQVDNIQQGRLWMAALMKATIERDLNLPVRTTNKQKTVSLKQAREMNQLPPALLQPSGKDSKQTEQHDSEKTAPRASPSEEPRASIDFDNMLGKLNELDKDPWPLVPGFTPTSEKRISS